MEAPDHDVSKALRARMERDMSYCLHWYAMSRLDRNYAFNIHCLLLVC